MNYRLFTYGILVLTLLLVAGGLRQGKHHLEAQKAASSTRDAWPSFSSVQSALRADGAVFTGVGWQLGVVDEAAWNFGLHDYAQDNDRVVILVNRNNHFSGTWLRLSWESSDFLSSLCDDTSGESQQLVVESYAGDEAPST